MENTPDDTLQANLAANASQKSALGIAGRLNTSGNDGTVTRFGWKAQNKSLLIFAGEAIVVAESRKLDTHLPRFGTPANQYNIHKLPACATRGTDDRFLSSVLFRRQTTKNDRPPYQELNAESIAQKFLFPRT